MSSEAWYRAIKGNGMEMWTTKQMLQRLPLPIPQVKAGNG